MLEQQYVLMGKVQERYFYCSHPAINGWGLHIGWARPPYRGMEEYKECDRIDRPDLCKDSKFDVRWNLGRWQEFRRTTRLRPDLVPKRDTIEINGKKYLVEERSQRLDDGAIVYYLDYVVDVVDDEDSKKLAQAQIDKIEQLNKMKQEHLRQKLENENLSQEVSPEDPYFQDGYRKPKLSFWERLRRCLEW